VRAIEQVCDVAGEVCRDVRRGGVNKAAGSITSLDFKRLRFGLLQPYGSWSSTWR
jgi:hypothetical protein